MVLDRADRRLLRLATRSTAGPAAGPAVTNARAAIDLPDGVTGMTFPNDTVGWAVASSGTCRNGKRDCSYTTSLVSTSDGGASWHTTLSWVERIN